MGRCVVARVAHNKLTKEIVNKRLQDAAQGVCLIGEYVDAKTKCEFLCRMGHEWLGTPAAVMAGHGCPHCSKNAKLSKEIVNSKLESQGRKIRLVGDYKNARTKTEFICESGHSWIVAPHRVLSGGNCPHCSGRAPLTKEKINQRIAASGRGAVMVGDFTTTEDKSEFECEKGHKWLATPRSVLSGNNCPHCARQARLSKDVVNKRLVLAGRGIKLISGYANNREKAKFECDVGHTWLASTSNVLTRSGCPHCVRGTDSVYIWESNGEIFNGKKVYKIGVTKNSRGHARLRECATSSGRTPIILRLEKVRDVADLERKLLELGEKPEYLYKFDGYTEMRAFDGEEITKALKMIDDNKESRDD